MTKYFIEVGNEFKTNSHGKVVVIEKLPKGRFLVRFETGSIVNVHRGNLVAGKVKDPAQKNPNKIEWHDCKIQITSNSGMDLTIIKKNAKKCIVIFKHTQHITEAYLDNVYAGKIIDPYQKTVLGIGYLGEPAQKPFKNKAKQLWSNMMKRCYNPKDTRGYYGRAFVDPRWHCFASFLEDLPSLTNFHQWLNSDETGIKYNLDKDLLIEGNKIYSKYTCQFITEFENKSAGGINRHK